MTKDEIAGIAAGLSKAQWAAIRDASPLYRSSPDALFITARGRGRNALLDSLHNLHLVAVSTFGPMLTNGGLAVRNHLKDHPHADR
jgi:hypothetical protein